MKNRELNQLVNEKESEIKKLKIENKQLKSLLYQMSSQLLFSNVGTNTNPPLINKESVDCFFNLIAVGNIIDADKLLQKIPGLALAKGDLTDLKGREFKNITAFQYVTWCLDSEMWNMFLNKKYLTLSQAKSQVDEFENERSDITNQYGLHLNFDPFFKAYEPFTAEQVLSGLLREQSALPPWYIYAICEVGKEVAWLKNDFSIPIKRNIPEAKLWIQETPEAKWRGDHNNCVIDWAWGMRDALTKDFNTTKLFYAYQLEQLSLLRSKLNLDAEVNSKKQFIY